MPAMTPLLNGQAMKVRLASTRVTATRGSARLRARAMLAPAKPPPTTTTRGAAPWARSGAGSSAAQLPTVTDFRKSRRLRYLAMIGSFS